MKCLLFLAGQTICCRNFKDAAVAQLVEHRIRNA